ncbi:MAG: hypothetical protein WC803_12775 [Sphingomonas sp.]|jgi:hypothetical protein
MTNKINLDFLFSANLMHHGNSGDALTDAIENMTKLGRQWVTIENVERMNEENEMSHFQGDNQSWSGGSCNNLIEQ